MSGNLLNVALYQTGWLLSVTLAGRGRPGLAFGVAATLVAVHLALAWDRRAELRLVAIAALVGVVVDSTEMALGILVFPGGGLAPGLCPPWIVTMWMQFATTFRFSLAGLVTRPRLAAALGALGGPVAYRIGETFGAVTLGEPRAAALLGLALVWATVLPGLGWVASRTEPAGYRVGS